MQNEPSDPSGKTIVPVVDEEGYTYRMNPKDLRRSREESEKISPEEIVERNDRIDRVFSNVLTSSINENPDDRSYKPQLQ